MIISQVFSKRGDCHARMLGRGGGLALFTLLIATAGCAGRGSSGDNAGGTSGASGDDTGGTDGDEKPSLGGTSGADGSDDSGGASGAQGGNGGEQGTTGGIGGSVTGGMGGGAAGSGGQGGAAGAANTGGAAGGTASVAQPIDGFRWEVPCKSNTYVTAELCPSERTLVQTRKINGDPNVTYEVTIRLRGLIEPHTFTGLDGKRLTKVTPAPYMVDSSMAKPDNIPYALFMIDVPAPKLIYYFNAFHSISGMFHHLLLPVDYTAKLKIQGGSMLKMAFTDGNTEQVANFKREIIPGIPPAPQPFNGQFLQLDVVSVSP